MLRTISGLFSLLSAVLCIAVIVLAVRTRHQTDILLLKTPGSHLAGAATEHYGIIFASTDLPYTGFVSIDMVEHPVSFSVLKPEEFQTYRDTLFDTANIKFSFLGFRTAAGQINMTAQTTPRFAALRLPCWFLAIIFALLPLGVGRGAWTRFRWKRKGLCLGCGYDIRASHGRCPECGRPIPGSATVSV